MNVETASYSELKNYVKGVWNRKGASAHFSNYPQKTKESLRKLVERWRSESNIIETKQQCNQTIKTEKMVNTETTIHEVIDVLCEALDKLKNLPSYANEKELQELHSKAMEIESEIEFAS